MKQQNEMSARALTMAELENVNGGKRRLKSLSEKNNSYADVIEYMLKNNCKLEQEIISWKDESL